MSHTCPDKTIPGIFNHEVHRICFKRKATNKEGQVQYHLASLLFFRVILMASAGKEWYEISY